MRLLITTILLITCFTVKGQTFDTRNKYTNSSGKNIIIENSFPKGGLKYTTATGERFVYAIFWTRLKNETAVPLELTINFPADSFQLPFSVDNSVKLLLPPNIMSLEKEPLFNYGLTNLDHFLDNNHNKKSNLKRIINPDESYLFYVTTLYNNGINGNVRAGFILKNNQLFYKISGMEIPCGSIEPLL